MGGAVKRLPAGQTASSARVRQIDLERFTVLIVTGSVINRLKNLIQLIIENRIGRIRSKMNVLLVSPLYAATVRRESISGFLIFLLELVLPVIHC